MVIVEYCHYGNLSTFLKSKREVFVHHAVRAKAGVHRSPGSCDNSLKVLRAATTCKIARPKTHFCKEGAMI